jgi:hypothetical protein
MRVEIYFLLLALAAGSALLCGTRGERWIGATVLAGNLLTFALERTLRGTFSSVIYGYLGLDAVLAAILCMIAVRHPSWVAICVAAFQVNGTLGHLVRLLATQTIPFSYAFLLKVWAWPMVLVLLASRLLPGMHDRLLARNWPPFTRRA